MLKITRNKVIATVGVLLALVAAWFLRGVIAYFLVAALISFIAQPLMRQLERRLRWRKKPLPRYVFALICIVVIIAVISGLLYTIVPPLLEQANNLSHITPDEFKRSFGPPLHDLELYFAGLGLETGGFSQDKIKNLFMSWVNMGNIRLIAGNLVGVLSAASGWIFSVLFITFFFLKEKYLFYRIIHILTPEKQESRMQRIMRDMNEMLGRYFRSLIIQIFVFGAYIFVGLTIFGEKYALTIAVFSGIMNLVSYIGPILGVSIALLFSIGSHIGADFYQTILPHLFEVGMVYAVAILLDNLVSYPLIFSNSLKVHPLELFFIVLAGFQLGGLTGMIVAAPLYTMLRIIAKELLQGFEVVQNITRRL